MANKNAGKTYCKHGVQMVTCPRCQQDSIIANAKCKHGKKPQDCPDCNVTGV